LGGNKACASVADLLLLGFPQAHYPYEITTSALPAVGRRRWLRPAAPPQGGIGGVQSSAGEQGLL